MLFLTNRVIGNCKLQLMHLTTFYLSEPDSLKSGSVTGWNNLFFVWDISVLEML